MKAGFFHRFLFLSAALGLVPAGVVAGGPCNPSSLETCGLPFPSDYWSQTDLQSPTGRQLAVSNEIIRSEVLEQLPAEDGITPEAIFRGDSGFSAASAVIFELAGAPDESMLPRDGGTAVRAFNLTTGNEVPLRAEVSNYARSDQVSEPSQVVEIYPRDRWGFGEATLVVLTRDLEVDEAGPDFRQVVDEAEPGSEEAAYLDRLADRIQQAGIALAEVRNATLFTSRDRGELLDDQRRLVERAFETPQQVRDLEVKYDFLNADIHARVTGELQLMNYRVQDGTGLVDHGAEPVTQWTGFRLTVPAASRKGPAPVALYAHGLGANKSSDVLVGGMNAGLGIATFSIDFPNHGERAERDGGGVFDNLDTENIATQVGMVNQNAIDFAAAHSALIHGLADLDIASKPGLFDWVGRGGDGVPDLDTDRVLMQGTSLGGVLGMGYAALSPQLDGGVFHVTGSGITSILSGSILWELAFSELVPSRATGAEALLMKSAIQQALDHGDPINYVDLMRHPDRAQGERPTLILAGAGDTIVPNDSTIATANLMDLPIVGPVRFEMPGVETADDYVNGFGVRHYRPLVSELLFGDALAGASSHGNFIRLSAMADQKEWIRRFFLE